MSENDDFTTTNPDGVPADGAGSVVDSAPAEPGTDVGQAEVQALADEADAKGYLGHTTDPTPNEHYTVSGVIAGLPTPETDEQAATDALLHQSALNKTVFSGPTVAQQQ